MMVSFLEYTGSGSICVDRSFFGCNLLYPTLRGEIVAPEKVRLRSLELDAELDDRLRTAMGGINESHE
jgi:hypothetical protein